MTDREIKLLANTILAMLDRWKRAAEERERRKYARKIRRERKESA